VGKNVAVFVDVANIFYAAKAAGVDIDYVLLLKSATAGRDLVRAYAYTGLDPDNENQRNFHSFLARHDFRVVSKDIRKYGDGKVKANLDIELVVDMMKTARNLDVAVVVSGDGDFAPAIRAVQEMGVRVEVISFRGNTSSDLMDVADKFTDITQLAKVEKGSTVSGRRVASDDEDLSMTEVPDKLSEGTGRGRGRGRVRVERVPAAATRTGVERAVRAPRTRRAVPVVADERGPAEELDEQGVIIALPGEKLSKARVLRTAIPAVTEAAEIEVEAADVAEAAPDGSADALETEGDGDAPRRRRRRGGRGRGRGRGHEGGVDGVTEGDAERLPVAARVPTDEELEFEVDDESIPAAARPPRPAAFGSVWDSQIGVAAPVAGRPATEDEEFDDEPEIPEYLLAERRNRGGQGARGGQPIQGNRGGRGRGGSYAAAYFAMLGRAFKPNATLMWPSAHAALMGPEQAATTLAMVRDNIHEREGTSWTDEEREAFKQPVRRDFEAFADPYNFARNLWCDMVIDPVETREVMALLLDLAGRTPAKKTKFGVFRM